MTGNPLSLFQGYGIEIESAVVDRETLDVRPYVDRLLREASGADDWVEDHDDGAIGWSNELVAHCVELKTNGPVPSFDGLAETFRASVGRMNALLGESWGARLLPTGMHPWMDAARETRLWSHEHGPVYRAYDRLFDCRSHGWANVQSVHLNLPFAGEDEFGRLMSAARLVLPLIPALAASSPVVEGRATGLLDTRLDFYRANSSRVPAMTAGVIPEPIYTFDAYRERVLGALDAELAAIGADEVLRGREWTNARGAIARFDRMAVEIRLIDAQESSPADLAVAAAVAGVARALVEERWSGRAAQAEFPSESLRRLLAAAERDGPGAPLDDPAYARLLGLGDGTPATMGAAWKRLAPATFVGSRDLEAPLENVLEHGTLAERILRALGPGFGRERLREVYAELAEGLAEGRPFRPRG